VALKVTKLQFWFGYSRFVLLTDDMHVHMPASAHESRILSYQRL